MNVSMKKYVAAIVLAAGAILALAYFDVPLPGVSSEVDRLVARNVAARGGQDAWSAVSTLRLSGRMDLGPTLTVPYVLEQARPDRMRLEFEFDGETSVQTVDGDQGWKLAPFRGRTVAQPMTDMELRETAASGDPGLLFNYKARGHRVVLLGHDTVEGRDTYKLEVTLPSGAVRWLYLDADTALDVKLEAVRNLAGRDRLVETYYRDWLMVDGLLIPKLQETRASQSDEWTRLTVDRVELNPPLDDERFAMPAMSVAQRG